jgi:3'-5' exoribonuclease
MHHAYWHGLLEHSVHVTRIVHILLPLYPQENKDLAIAGALLHDVGKVLEYRYESIEGIDRTRLGRLEGHVVLGYRLVRSAALRHQLESEWLERLEHILLSHQGELAWGAAVYPSTPEAIFIALADNFDAKMAMVQQQLRKALPQQIFSDFVPGLQTRLMTQPLVDLH